MLRAQGEKILSILSIYRIPLITFVPCTKAVFTDTQVQLACVQTSPLPQEPLPIFPEGGGPSVHRLKFSVRNNYVNPQRGGGTPSRKLYGYVPPHRVGFLRRFGLKTGIHFAHFGLESGMVFGGITGVYERIYRFNRPFYSCGLSTLAFE